MAIGCFAKYQITFDWDAFHKLLHITLVTFIKIRNRLKVKYRTVKLVTLGLLFPFSMLPLSLKPRWK
jgi:hypothetical protein